VHGSVDNAGRYGVEANVFLCIPIAKLRVTASTLPFVIIGTEPGTPAIGLTTVEAGDADDAAASFLRKHLLHRSLRHVEETLEVHERC